MLSPTLMVEDIAKSLEFYTQTLGLEEVGRMAGPDGNLIFDRAIADSIAQKKIFVTPTIQLHRDKLETCIRQREAGDKSAELQNQIDMLNRMWEKVLGIFGKLLKAGVTMVAGNDAGLPLTGFGLLWRELEGMVMGGMTAMQAITAATKNAAAAIQASYEYAKLVFF